MNDRPVNGVTRFDTGDDIEICIVYVYIVGILWQTEGQRRRVTIFRSTDRLFYKFHKQAIFFA